MTQAFKYFAVLAGMRTGSNLLEERLNSLPGIHCYGEVFNPAFVGHANQEELFGMNTGDIGRAPVAFLKRMIEQTEGLAGFRLFEGHNAKVLQKCLTDPDCAKIVLRRNPVESYVSLKIAQATNQWRMKDAKNPKKAQITFLAEEFSEYLEQTQAHYAAIARQTKAAGQTVFYIDYTDLNDLDVLTGLASYLGASGVDFKPKSDTKKQNPEPLSQKVNNFDEMVQHLSTLDPIGLFHDPSFEPARGPDVKSYLISDRYRLLFAPVAGGPTKEVAKWLRAVDDDARDGPRSGLSQKEMRAWKRETPGHLSFTVLRHPVFRAWYAYREHLIQPGPALFRSVRKDMIVRYGVKFPKIGPVSEAPDPDLRAGFLSFLAFLRSNLAGQTTIRVDASWATQAETVEALTRFAPIQVLVREETLQSDLEHLSARVGAVKAQVVVDPELEAELGRIYDAEVEEQVRATYRRDYMSFGFGDWGKLGRA